MSNIKYIIITLIFTTVFLKFFHLLRTKQTFHQQHFYNPKYIPENSRKNESNYEIIKKSECPGLNFELSYNLR